MSAETMKYCEYFDVDEDFFPNFDQSAINSGKVHWNNTYPHETFIEMLTKMEQMLGGLTNRSLWIHGAYGTGKSLCAYTLKKILDAPEDEVRAYWNDNDSLRGHSDLLEKLLGHKKRGIVTAYRYRSGDIASPQKLFLTVQDIIKKALVARGVSYLGDNTLKEGVIAWLEDPVHNRFMNDLLQKPEWMSAFHESTAGEIIAKLKNGGEISELMDNIFKLAGKEGITALDLTADTLRDWIVDVIDENKISLVIVWDEFSDYFRNNTTTLSEFQKIVTICQEKPFYFVIVTHPLSSLDAVYGSGDKKSSWSVVQDRFVKVEITMPDSIAFDLIGHALRINPAAGETWEKLADDLNAYVPGSRAAVMEAAKITKESVMKSILPIHPMAAYVLKNIASAYGSNQRSMFDFIKTPKDLDVKAFQWFIQNTDPYSNRHYLTVDMLWNFFYEKDQKGDLSKDVRLVLDTFPQQADLTENEKTVLKTVLIMQALDRQLSGNLPLLKPTEENLGFAFEGDYGPLSGSLKKILRSLVNKGVLIENVQNNKKAYAIAVLAGHGAKIETERAKLRADFEKLNATADLVLKGPDVAAALDLTAALKPRFAPNSLDNGRLEVATISDFKRKMDAVKRCAAWQFPAVLALAKTEEEAQTFRAKIKETIADPAYQDVTVIDALSTPLGLEAFGEYVEYSAMAVYYQGNNNQQSKLNAQKAKEVLERGWKNRIENGQFFVFSHAYPTGERANGAGAVKTVLQTIVRSRFRHVQDFTKGLNEAQLKLTQAKHVAKTGIEEDAVKGLIAGCEKSVLGKFWKKPNYWQDESLAGESIVIVKKAVNALIESAFAGSGKISIGEICDYLEREFGFSPCNLSAFITGFLLKEYSAETYRSMDAQGHRVSMSPDKLAEMIAGCIGKSSSKPAYIVSLTEEEMAFYALTETAWNIPAGTCTSPENAGVHVSKRMRELAYPVWCLESMDTAGVFDLVALYIKLVQIEGDAAHDVANEIGAIAIKRPDAAQSLKALLTPDNCKQGMQLFLEKFEDGALLSLAAEIGAGDSVMEDIKRLFSVEHSALWRASTGEDEIRKLITAYEVVKATNGLLNVRAHSLDGACRQWREKLKFLGFSHESVKAKMPALSALTGILLRIFDQEDLSPDHVKSFLDELTRRDAEIREVLDHSLAVFMDVYAPYLEGFSEAECEEIKASIKSSLFGASATQANAVVKKAAEDHRKTQVKTRLFALWKSRTGGSKNPRDWSEKHLTPILCCVSDAQYAAAKRAFDTLNGGGAQSEANFKEALEFLQNAGFFDDIASAEFRDERFKQKIIGEYARLIPDVNAVREALERTGVSAYEWLDDPQIKNKVEAMANAEYAAGGSDKVTKIIESMSDADLKRWLIELAKKDMGLGIKIIDDKDMDRGIKSINAKEE